MLVVLYLVRHLRPTIDSGICYGWTDVPAQVDANAATDIAHKLGEVRALHSSSLTRCANLARALGGQLNLEVVVNDALKELNFGQWEMKTWDDIGAQAIDDWIASGYEATHSGESLTEFDARVERWAREQNPQLDIAVVTHAGVIRSFLRTFSAISLEESLAYPIAFGEIVTCEISA